MEVWKDVPNYEGYYKVSNKGNVIGAKLRKNLRLQITSKGYLRVKLYKDKIKKDWSVHRLVCYAFLDDWNDELQVNHINLIKDDNRLENLEMVTNEENYLHYLKATGKGYADELVKSIKANYFYLGMSNSELSKKYNVSTTFISDVTTGKRKELGI